MIYVEEKTIYYVRFICEGYCRFGVVTVGPAEEEDKWPSIPEGWGYKGKALLCPKCQ